LIKEVERSNSWFIRNGKKEKNPHNAELEQLEHFFVVKIAPVLLEHIELCGLLAFHRPVELQASNKKKYTKSATILYTLYYNLNIGVSQKP